MTIKSLQQIEDNLFFIVGCGRSGTTLFRIILNAHSGVFVPPETFFFNEIANGFVGINSSSEKKISKLLSKWWVRDMKVERNEILKLLDPHQASWRNVFLAFMGSLSSGSGATMFGEKTPGHIRYSQQLLDEYPKCKIIILVRDPRASFASFRSANVGTGQISTFSKTWSYAATIAKNLENNPRCMRVHFEKLITNTEDVMGSVCEFLDLSFDDSMMNYHSRTDPDYSPEQTHHKNTQKPIFTSGLTKWKSQLTNNQIGLLEYTLADQMAAMGYELEGNSVSFPRFRLLYSLFVDKLSKVFILKPRQILRKHRASLRQSQDKL